VDNTNFFTQGSNAINKMQIILNACNRLYKVIGRMIEIIKITFFSWKCQWKRGKKCISNINIELKINNNVIKQTNMN